MREGLALPSVDIIPTTIFCGYYTNHYIIQVPFRNEELITPAIGSAASNLQHQPFWEIVLAEEIRDTVVMTMGIMLSVREESKNY